MSTLIYPALRSLRRMAFIGALMIGRVGGEIAALGATESLLAPSNPAPLETVREIYGLAREVAEQGLAVQLEGVVTCVLGELNAIVIEDSTGAVYATLNAGAGELPPLGERVALGGITATGIVKASQVERRGPGQLPPPERPSWNQLMNGSLNCRWVELQGVVERMLHRSNGWTRINLRMQSGLLHVEVRRAGVTPALTDNALYAVISLRGCMFADWNLTTHRVKAGQIRMHDVELTIAEPAATDPFSLPRKSAAELMSYNPDYTRFQRVRVAGQVVFALGQNLFLMDGGNGMRLLDVETPTFQPGDLVEAVGFPDWGYGSPYIRVIQARKIGRSALPESKVISDQELLNSWYDAQLVRVQGVLASVRPENNKTTLEIQSGSWRFLARIYFPANQLGALALGSKLELSGVYCAQSANRTLGADVAPIDLLVNTPQDIRVLATPSWWTRDRLLVGAGVLALIVIAMLLWVSQLRQQVEQRTTEIRVQIQNRERAEQQHAIAAERARIAHDLHDELGADLTEIGMLTNRARTAPSEVTTREKLLTQAANKTTEMVSKLEEIVWATNPHNDKLGATASYFGFYADQFLGLANIKVRMEKNLSETNDHLDSRVRHQLFLVFKEALTNIVKHAAATEVTIRFTTTRSQLTLAIADNGSGMSQPQVAAGRNGIANMRNRIAALGGEFTLRPGASGGTEVVAHIPLS